MQRAMEFKQAMAVGPALVGFVLQCCVLLSSKLSNLVTG